MIKLIIETLHLSSVWYFQGAPAESQIMIISWTVMSSNEHHVQIWIKRYHRIRNARNKIPRQHLQSNIREECHVRMLLNLRIFARAYRKETTSLWRTKFLRQKMATVERLIIVNYFELWMISHSSGNIELAGNETGSDDRVLQGNRQKFTSRNYLAEHGKYIKHQQTEEVIKIFPT